MPLDEQMMRLKRLAQDREEKLGYQVWSDFLPGLNKLAPSKSRENKCLSWQSDEADVPGSCAGRIHTRDLPVDHRSLTWLMVCLIICMF